MDEQIKKIMNKLVLSGATPGINYKVITENQTFEGSLGLKSKYGMHNGNLVELEEVNHIDTLYDIASLTKVVCTVAIIFRLIERGKIGLHDYVNQYLPKFKYDDITIYDLLTHMSGLSSFYKPKEITTKKELEEKLYEAKVRKKKKFIYSDLGYILLGFIIEKVCGKSLNKVFEEEVTIPLAMKHTKFCPANIEMVAPTEITKERGIVRGIVHDEKTASMNGIAGHAGVFSTVDDLSHFACMILNDGVFQGKKYLDKSSIEKWFSPLVVDRTYKRSFSWYVGNNPSVIKKVDKDTISFSGFTGPSISINRKKNIIVIMLTNRVHPTRKNKLNVEMRCSITKQIYDIFETKVVN